MNLHQAPDLHALPCGLLNVGHHDELLWVNQTFAQWLGHDVDALIGQTLTTLMPQTDLLTWHACVLPMLDAEGVIEEVLLTLHRAQGGTVDVLLNARRVPSPNEGGLRMQISCFRLLARRRLELQLLTAKRVAEEAPGLLFQMRRQPGGQVAFTYVTEGMRTLFGVSPSVALRDASAVWAAVHPEDLPRLQLAMTRSADQLQPWRQEYRVRLQGLEQWRETHASPSHEPDGTLLWHGYTADISARKQMEQSLRDKEAAEQANQAKSGFLARMSHELRTPLNGILGFARLLKVQGAPLDEDQRRKVGYIEAAGDSLLHLINEVLEISRIEAGHTSVNVQPMQIDGILRQALRLNGPAAAARQVRLLSPARQGWWAEADEHRLLQVLNNLLSNAIKYGPPSGTVRLSVAAEEGVLTISVQDEGPGLSVAQQAQLFEPFNRLGAERSGVEGVGLGLVITRGLVELMGGHMTVESAPGQGACFNVHLQGVDEPGAPPPSDWVSTGPGEFDSPDDLVASPMTPAADEVDAVLYVEDNRVNAVLMQAVFETQSRFSLTVVETGAEAISALASLRPCALMLDMHLPDTDGIALLQRLRRLPGLAEVPAVVVSADAMPADIERALASGFSDYWTKPLDVARVLPGLTALVDAPGAPSHGP